MMTEKEQQHIFETWLDKYKALLFKVVRAYAFTESDQDDLFQEIAIQLWRSVPNFREESAVTTWLYRIALNTAIKWNRDEQKYREGHRSFDKTKHLLQEKQEAVDQRLEWMYRQISKLDKVDRSL